MPDGEGESLLHMQVAKKTYILNINQRFAYVKRFNVLKRPMEQVEHPLVKRARAMIMQLTGRKGERRR
jgi:hypothetical protein